MQLFKQLMDIIGYLGTGWLLVSGALLFFACLKGILVPVWRLGLGLARRKITIFARGDNKESFEKLLFDTSLYNPKNVTTITKTEDIGRCENSTLFIVVWEDYKGEINEILAKKSDKTALIIFAEPMALQKKDWALLGKHRNVTVVNFRGRLLSDILVSLMVTGYDKR